MIKDVSSDIFSLHSSFGGRCMAALIALVVVGLLGLLGWLGFILVDSVGITSTKTTVTVVGAKQVVPAHTTILLVGKVVVPQYHSESYLLHFRIDGKEVSSAVTNEFFADVCVGDRIQVDYGLGRLSNSHQPTSIRLVDR